MGFGALAEDNAADPLLERHIASIFPAVLASSRGIHFAGQSSRRFGPEGSGSLPAPRSSAASKTHRHHHGRQRALGPAAPHAARGRTSRRSGGGAFDGRDGSANWIARAHPLRILRGKLEETAEERGRLPDAPAVPLS